MPYCVPDLASKEISAVVESLKRTIHDLCKVSSVAGTNADAAYFLDASEYLFLSTNVAKQHPHLLESVIVRRYQSYLPEELGRKWLVGALL